MSTQPLVSVLMPVYNAEKFIKESIESIINQSYRNWELIILNDGSSDNSIQIINEFREDRIKVYENEQNSGLTFTRNKLVQLAKGDFIAWLDADDIALPYRLELQANFLSNKEEIDLIGGAVQPIDSTGKEIGKQWRYSAKKEAIPSLLVFHNYFAQSAIMLRRLILEGMPYRKEFPPVEDYDLWIRLLGNHQGYNLKELVVKYRVHPENVTHRMSRKVEEGMKKIKRNQFRALIPDNKFYEDTFVNNFANADFATSIKIMLQLYLFNKTRKLYPINIFGAVILKQLLSKIKRNMNFRNILLLIKSDFLKYSYSMLLYKI